MVLPSARGFGRLACRAGVGAEKKREVELGQRFAASDAVTVHMSTKEKACDGFEPRSGS